MTTMEAGEKVFINDEEYKYSTHGVQQAWASSDNLAPHDDHRHSPTRVTRDQTFNTHAPNSKSKVDVTKTQPRLYEEYNGSQKTRAKRRNSISTYLPTRSLGVNNFEHNSVGSPSLSSGGQGRRNTFHQVKPLPLKGFGPRELCVSSDRSEANCVPSPDQNHNGIPQQVELDFNQGRRSDTSKRVSRRHSVTSLSSSYGDYVNQNRLGNSCDKLQKGETQGREEVVTGASESSEDKSVLRTPWCQDGEQLSGFTQDISNVVPHSGRDGISRARRHDRRASYSVIEELQEKHVPVEASDEGILNLILALKRDINPNNPRIINNSEESDSRFRRDISNVKQGRSIAAGLHGKSDVPTDCPVAIHLPDSGACSVESRVKAPPIKDTHISLVYSADLNVDSSLEDVLKCAKSGLGTHFSEDSFKSVKRSPGGHRKVTNEAEGHKVKDEKSQGQHGAESTVDNTCLIHVKDIKEIQITREEFVTGPELSVNARGCIEKHSQKEEHVKHNWPKSSGAEGAFNEHKELSRPCTDGDTCFIEASSLERPGHTLEQEVSGVCLTCGETTGKLPERLDYGDKVCPGFDTDVLHKVHGHCAHGHCYENCVICEDPVVLVGNCEGNRNDSKKGSQKSKHFGNLTHEKKSRNTGERPDYLGRNLIPKNRSWSASGKVQSVLDKSVGEQGLGRKAVVKSCLDPTTLWNRGTESVRRFEHRDAKGNNRPRSYSLDSGQRGLVRQAAVVKSDSDSESESSSNCEPSSLESGSDSEDLTPRPEESKKKLSTLKKIRHSLTAPDSLFSLLKKNIRKSHRPSTSDIYTISEEISPDCVSNSQEEKENLGLNFRGKQRKDERPKSLSDETELDNEFKTFADKANERQRLREQNAIVQTSEDGSVFPKNISLLRRKSLHDFPDIFDKFVRFADVAPEESEESILSPDSSSTTDSVFERGKGDSSSGTETDDEESSTASEYQSEEDQRNFEFHRFSSFRTSVRRASIDIGSLDQVQRVQHLRPPGDIVSASLSDNAFGSAQSLQNGNDGIMGYAMATNQSSQNSRMVAETRSNKDNMHDYLQEYRQKFGRLSPGDQNSEEMMKAAATADLDSSTPSIVDVPQLSRTAQVLANPSIRRHLLQSQGRAGSRPSSRSSSPALTDSGPQSPKVKGLLGNAEFFFSSSESSPQDSRRGSFSESRGIGLRSSLRLEDHSSRSAEGSARLRERRSSSEMNLDQIASLLPGKLDSTKSTRSHTDPFPERSRSPKEILELSQRSMSEADSGMEILSKTHSDASFQDFMKKSSLKSKFHIPSFEEFKLKKKTTFSTTLDYIGQGSKSSHQPMKGVHSKLLVDQVRHARSMTALHEFELDDEAIHTSEGSGTSRKSRDSGTKLDDHSKDDSGKQNVLGSGCGQLGNEPVLKAPPRRRHRSSDGRKDGLSPRKDSEMLHRPKSMGAEVEDHHGQLQRTGSEQTLFSEVDVRSISTSEHSKNGARHDGSVNVPGVTVTDSDINGSVQPKRQDRRHRKKSRSMIELSKGDLETLEEMHRRELDQKSRLESCERSNSERSRTMHHSQRSRLNSESDLEKSEGHAEKGKRQKSGDKLTKTKSEPVPVDLTNKAEGHKRSKSEKSRRVKESHSKRHLTDSLDYRSSVRDAAIGGVEVDTVKHKSQHLRVDLPVDCDSASPVTSPRDHVDASLSKTRKSKSKKSHDKHKSGAKSHENLAKTHDLPLTVTSDHKLLKAQSMDNLNLPKKSHKHEKERKVKGQRPVSMGLPVDVDVDDESFGQEVAAPVKKNERLLGLPIGAESKGSVVRSISDVTDTKREEKRRVKNKKVRSSKSDPFDEKGRRMQPNLRGAKSQQHLAPDYGEGQLESSQSFQSIGDLDDDDTSSEVLLKRSSGRKPKKTSNVSTTSVDSGVINHDGPHDLDEDGIFGSADIERVDSGVGCETKYSSKKDRKLKDGIICLDCDKPIPTSEVDIITEVATICKKCISRRTERKETIQEIIDTEVSYGRDLKIIKEEFFKPMQNASLLTSEQTQSVFLNFQELMDINDKFADFLQDAVENANEQGDEDYNSVQIGKIFLDFSFMFIAFENYCVHQSSASLVLEQMEKERELLRIFLQISQRDNPLLRRMNLKSFLMVPVQRIVKYPLLLTRLYKSTPLRNTDRVLIKEAQLKIEEILDHINASAKGGSSSAKTRTKGSIMRKGGPSTAAESVEIQKVAFETIGKNRNDAFCVMMGRLNYAVPSENAHWTKKGKGLKFNPLQAVVLALGKTKSEYSVDEDLLLFPKKGHTSEALMVLLKEKNGKYIPAREPLSLDKCVVSVDQDFDEIFEVHEINKDTLFFKADDTKENIIWVRHLKYQAKDVGTWRRRRQALANIMFSKS